MTVQNDSLECYRDSLPFLSTFDYLSEELEQDLVIQGIFICSWIIQVYFWEWRNICRITCCSCITPDYLPLIMKPNGFWGIISGNRRRPWHLGASKVSIISANAWACLFWCAWKNRQIYSTECPRYLDKKNRWLWLLSVYTISFLKSI